MKHTIHRILFDIISAALAWISFFYYRKRYIEQIEFEPSQTFYAGVISVTIFWIIVYFISGSYIDTRRVSRLNELQKTLYQSITGCIIVFFLLIIDDIKNFDDYRIYYVSIIVLLTTHFTFTFIGRYFLTNRIVKQIQAGKIKFNTILIGDSTGIEKTFKKFQNSRYRFIGFIDYQNKEKEIPIEIESLGQINNLESIIQKYNIEECILAIEKNQLSEIEHIIYILTYHDILTKINPNLVNLLAGQVKMTSLIDTPLVEIKQIRMSFFEKIIKRIIDVFASLMALLILSPLFIIISILIKSTSKGPILYRQERIGYKNKVFKIIKFRSMYIGSERNQPLLSSNNDQRITSWGKIMRKYRLDELPQFFNVLKGEMSIVGPRPERDFFAKQILNKAPYYKLIHKVRPGITSWGMVKFGYAENVKEMIKRLKYDIIYIENLSLLNDLKVLIFTVVIVLQGRGK